MGCSEQMPDPCITCKTMQKYGCRMQPICTKVKAYRRRAVAYQLDGQAVERAYRIQKLHGHKYKGGAM